MKRKNPPRWDVYCYRCLCTTCQARDIYVGAAKWSAYERHRSHIREATKIIDDPKAKASQAFHYFIAKHGVNNLELRVLRSCSSSEDMYTLEIECIESLRTSTEFGGMNVHRGGKGGRVFCLEETRRKISSSLKIHHEREPQSREKSKAGRIRWLHTTPNAASDRAKLAWETKRKRAAEDPKYAIKMHDAAVSRGKRGKEAQMSRGAVP